MKNLRVTFRQNEYEVSPLMTVTEFVEQHGSKVKHPIAAVLNGHLTRLSTQIMVNSSLEIIELHTYQGQRIYESSLLFLFTVAFKKRFPNLSVFIQHSLPNGIFAETKERALTAEEIRDIELEMQVMVKKNLPINRITRDWDVSLEKMQELGRSDLINLFRFYSPTALKIYELEGIEECQYMPLVPSTGYISEFCLSSYKDGIIIQYADYEKGRSHSSRPVSYDKLFHTFKEYHDWSKILKIRTVGQLNRYIMNDDIGSLVQITEALHEKKVAEIADAITKRPFPPKLILIAGPSSSGKTTFSKRLDVQLRVNRVRPIAISLDDYFLERGKTPKDKDGNYDFESLRAIDVPLFGEHLAKLLNGEAVQLPIFEFKTGTRQFRKEALKLEDDQMLIIEGIHGINPELTKVIESKYKFKIYVSALTQMNLHRHERIPTSDTRLIRRIVRDFNFRGYGANATLLQWPKVRAGEAENIFPHQETVDYFFNSALFYELSILKGPAERELLKVPKEHPMYSEAQRLLTFLSFFLPLESGNVPKTSILREFIGGSSFRY